MWPNARNHAGGQCHADVSFSSKLAGSISATGVQQTRKVANSHLHAMHDRGTLTINKFTANVQ
jgi:hypothetical protein